MRLTNLWEFGQEWSLNYAVSIKELQCKICSWVWFGLLHTWNMSHTAEWMDICCRDHGCDFFFFSSFFFCGRATGSSDDLNTTLSSAILLKGLLILSLVHLISTFNRWMVGMDNVASRSTYWWTLTGCHNRCCLTLIGRWRWEGGAAGFVGVWVWLMSGVGETPGGWSLRGETERKPSRTKAVI